MTQQHWDYVDIGTSDFDTSIIHAPEAKVLLVEPLDFYLNTFKNLENVTLCNCAVSDSNGTIDTYYISEDNIASYGLPQYIKGCNSVGKPHPLTVDFMNVKNIPKFVLQKKLVPMITFSELCKRYDISSIGVLKLDTEGHDHFILPDVLNFVKTNHVQTIIVEYQEYAGNTHVLDQMFSDFIKQGYELSRHSEIDMKLEKRKENETILRFITRYFR